MSKAEEKTTMLYFVLKVLQLETSTGFGNSRKMADWGRRTTTDGSGISSAGALAIMLFLVTAGVLSVSAAPVVELVNLTVSASIDDVQYQVLRGRCHAFCLSASGRESPASSGRTASQSEVRSLVNFWRFPTG